MPYDMIVGPGRDKDNLSFGELLEDLRKKAGVSRAEAADRIGVSAEYVRLIETGQRTPALGQMTNFLAAYDANGGVEVRQPDGSRPDLILMNPLDEPKPVFVQFRSRIREKRWKALGVPAGTQGHEDEGPDQDSASELTAELGATLLLLAAADLPTIRRVRQFLSLGAQGSHSV